MRRVHLIFGVVSLVAFAATGMVMRLHRPPLTTMSDDVRLMYRSRHIYLLGAGVANLLLGLYMVRSRAGWRRGFQTAGSILFLASPILLGLAFFAEPGNRLSSGLWRSHLGLYALLGGTILHFLFAERGMTLRDNLGMREPHNFR
jgi:hypothetical protein